MFLVDIWGSTSQLARSGQTSLLAHPVCDYTHLRPGSSGPKESSADFAGRQGRGVRILNQIKTDKAGLLVQAFH